jgi:taurine--2-oxoglutarate transaminase
MCSFAKGVTGAYIPLSGVAARSHIYDFFRKTPLGIGSTFFAHPMCMAIGYASVKYNMESNLLENV